LNTFNSSRKYQLASQYLRLLRESTLLHTLTSGHELTVHGGNTIWIDLLIVIHHLLLVDQVLARLAGTVLVSQEEGLEVDDFVLQLGDCTVKAFVFLTIGFNLSL
jgi:hypothetical protein